MGTYGHLLDGMDRDAAARLGARSLQAVPNLRAPLKVLQYSSSPRNATNPLVSQGDSCGGRYRI